jgi:hypothetical protein
MLAAFAPYDGRNGQLGALFLRTRCLDEDQAALAEQSKHTIRIGALKMASKSVGRCPGTGRCLLCRTDWTQRTRERTVSDECSPNRALLLGN